MPRFVCESAHKIFHVGGENGILFSSFVIPILDGMIESCLAPCCEITCHRFLAPKTRVAAISYHAIKNTVNKKKCSWKLDPICPLYGKSGNTPSPGGWVISWFTYNTIAIPLLFLHSLTQNTETHQQVFYVIHRFGITLT